MCGYIYLCVEGGERKEVASTALLKRSYTLKESSLHFANWGKQIALRIGQLHLLAWTNNSFEHLTDSSAPLVVCLMHLTVGPPGTPRHLLLIKTEVCYF